MVKYTINGEKYYHFRGPLKLTVKLPGNEIIKVKYQLFFAKKTDVYIKKINETSKSHQRKPEQNKLNYLH